MAASPIVLLGRLPPQVRLLVAGTLINRIGSLIVPYLSIVLKREFQLSEAAVGLVLLGYGLGSVLSILLGGVLTDRLGRRRTLLLSLGGSGTMASLMAFVPSLAALALLLVPFGFLADLYRPASSAIVSDLLPSSMRAVGYAALRMATNLGFALGMVIGGSLADSSWRLLFAGDGATTLLFGILVFTRLAETKPAVAAALPGSSAAASPWSDRTFLLACLGSLLYSQAFFVDFTVLPLTITGSAGYPSIVYGLLLALNGLLIAFFELPIVHALRTCRRLRVSAAGVLVLCAGVGATGVAMHWSWFLVTILLWTLGEILVVPQQMSFVADWAPPEALGRYLSVYGATWSLAMAFGPALFLPLHARLGEALFWPAVAALALPAAGIALFLDGYADRPSRLRGHSERAPEAPLIPATAPGA